MKKAILITAFLANSALAQDYTQTFSADTFFQTKANIEIVVSNNVTEDCNKERARSGQKPFNLPSRACTFYKPGYCKIIIKPSVSEGTLGHELRHCLAGSFHD